MYRDALSTQPPPSSLQPGLDCSRTCKGRPRVHINPPSCSRPRRWGQEAVCISWPSSAHRKNHCRSERRSCDPILKIFVFPLFYISEGLDVIIHRMTMHLAGWGTGQA